MAQWTLEDFDSADPDSDEADLREDVTIGPRPDGHAPRADPDDPEWAEDAGQTALPLGRVMVVLDPDLVAHGWPVAEPVRRGVYLPGRHSLREIRPAPPVEADDDRLRVAASACLIAALETTPAGAQIAAAVKSSRYDSLTIAVEDEPTGQCSVLHSGGNDRAPVAPTTGDRQFGFTNIRLFGTPHKIYTVASEPRLSISDLATDPANVGLEDLFD